ncbi:hypothetical protein BALCAV_0213770 [Alkalihalobacillus alcalophilus ATCC 27647 = CGMCC 1.3604]|uniref:Sulfatase-modifying factor enzyme-like domain-containing protein n=3 Tax=Alkalihalobacillus alcalophilus TaxID=1445 RepID=A0A094WLQ5_ALKAL|nr:SUMF1/EgtB/PvdO family nonheme iron enzyme [Bacillus phage BalMu-1]AJA42428.1 hypothetical protein BalMu1_B50 [Bacillus phage BalMu-1]AJA42484.1 hypothetical protein BalMu1_A50 [Bacillus phage BalMu-1]KGA96878.1 hypothetical protein BALCAV_0213770 [Alkalihalobacillus alcalophilus ATCC 27647 = CGMCC 1.3604]
MNNFDALKLAVESMSGGKNTVVLDNIGMPSIVYRVQRFNLSDIEAGAPNRPHDMFIVNGEVVDAIGISKFQNIVVNDRAYSLPLKDPRVSINFEQAKAACAAKGGTWHLMTTAEWAGLALWSKKNGTMPHGNNDYGGDITHKHERGIETHKDGDRTGRVATGSGPATWSHDHTNEGIFDLNGNVWEWTNGLKIVDGIAHIMQNNNYNDPESQWINTGVDITAGMTSGQRITATRKGSIPNANDMLWDGLAIPETLSSSGSEEFGQDYYAFNREGERLPLRGGRWIDDVRAGVFALHLAHARSNSTSSVGFRSAVVL